MIFPAVAADFDGLCQVQIAAVAADFDFVGLYQADFDFDGLCFDTDLLSAICICRSQL